MKFFLYITFLFLLISLICGCGGGGGDYISPLPTSVPTSTPVMGSLNVEVVNKDGSPFAGAFVAFYNYDYPDEKISAQTYPNRTGTVGTDGKITFNDVPLGAIRLESWRSEGDYNNNPQKILASLNSDFSASSITLTLTDGTMELTPPSWEWKLTSTSEDLYGIYFIDNLEGWAVGTYGTVMHSENGGNSWEDQLIGTFDSLKAVCFIDRNKGWDS